MPIKKLKLFDIIALGLMTFALFVGAGNIISPPIVGLHAGENLWPAASGFLITAVGLPVLTLIALARNGGALEELTKPLGKIGCTLLAVTLYLAVGPFFAMPRTATVSFVVGIAPLTGSQSSALAIFSIIYFAVVISLSLNPGKLLDWVGKVLAPSKIVALAILGIAAFLYPAGGMGPVTEAYQNHPFSQGFRDGYLTMDTLGALVFGIVIVNAIRSRGVNEPRLQTRYTSMAAIIAGLGLVGIYTSLFFLGGTSDAIAGNVTNGAAILHAYVNHMFGSPGDLLLAFLIVMACLMTAVGLTCACADYFSKLTGLSYRFNVIVLVAFSVFVSNLGLDHLIAVSIPVLSAIYPPCIALVLTSFGKHLWCSPDFIIKSATAIALFFGIVDGLRVTGLQLHAFDWLNQLPLASMHLTWILPVALIAVIAFLYQYVADNFSKRETVK